MFGYKNFFFVIDLHGFERKKAGFICNYKLYIYYQTVIIEKVYYVANDGAKVSITQLIVSEVLQQSSLWLIDNLSSNPVNVYLL